MENELAIVARHAQSAPVNLRAMFADLGIDFAEQWISSGESGWIERNGDRYRVVVNASEPEARRRFTAAHELSHYLLHRDLMQTGERMNRHTDHLFDNDGRAGDTIFDRRHEVQANRLAAQIVMPAELVRAEAAKTRDAGVLAKAFRVSKPAMEIRLKTLGLIDQY